jgi:EpsI family protein
MMQSLTTAMVTRLVAWTGVPAFIEGNFVHVPAGTFEIASGCSGLNYLVVGLALGGLYGLMYLDRWKHRIALLGIAAVLALVSNWIRVYSLILVGHLSDMQHYLITVEHHIYGWVLFLVLMAPMLLVARRLEDREGAAAIASSGLSSENHRQSGSETVVKARSSFELAVAPAVLPAALVTAIVLLIPRALDSRTTEIALPNGTLPETLAGYSAVARTSTHWRPVFINAVQDHAAFDDGRGVIEVHRAFYLHQDRDHRIVQAGNDFLGDGFLPTGHGRHEIQSLEGQLTISTYRGSLADEERLVWSWYWVAGRAAATPKGAKLAELLGLWDGRRDGMAVALSTSCRESCVSAEKRLENFLVEAMAELQDWPDAVINGSID